MANISPEIIMGIAERIGNQGVETIEAELEKRGTPALGELQEAHIKAFIASAFFSGVATCYRMQKDGHDLTAVETMPAYANWDKRN
jgi:hypothetical protein